MNVHHRQWPFQLGRFLRVHVHRGKIERVFPYIIQIENVVQTHLYFLHISIHIKRQFGVFLITVITFLYVIWTQIDAAHLSYSLLMSTYAILFDVITQ